MSSFDFNIRDTWDNGEFMTGATLDLIADGEVVHTETFVCSSEFPNDGTAVQQASSAGVSWIETQETPYEVAAQPFGLLWELEQEERAFPF